MVTDAGYGKRTKLERFNRQARGGQGVRGIRLTARRGRVVAAFMVPYEDEILLVSLGGVTIRTLGPGDRLPGPRRHRRAGHEPRRRARPWPRWPRCWPSRTEPGPPLTSS